MAALAVTCHPLRVEEILALSGYAFHVRWCLTDGLPTGCPGSVSLEQGYLPAAFSEHTGWRLRVLIASGWDHPDMQRAAPDIIASIDAGMPVVIEDRYIHASVLYGYARQGERYLLNTHVEGPIEAELACLSQDPAYAFILEEYVEPASYAEVFRSVLTNAVTWWHRELEPDACGGPDMRTGRVALEAWAQFYAAIDALAPAYPRGKGGPLYNSLMNYQHLYENRPAAVSFLSRHSAGFPRAEGAIRRAAELYQEEVAALASALDADDDLWPDINRVRTALVNRTPESAAWEAARCVDQADVWTPEAQRREHRIMEDALRLEALAIEHLREATERLST